MDTVAFFELPVNFLHVQRVELALSYSQSIIRPPFLSRTYIEERKGKVGACIFDFLLSYFAKHV